MVAAQASEISGERPSGFGVSGVRETSSRTSSVELRWIVPAVALTLFLLVVVRRAWLCDDVFVSLRVADNLWHGRGFVFNPGHRVQSFTNPLWTLLLAPCVGIFRDPYGAALALSLLTSFAFSAVFVFGARSRVLGAGLLVVFGATEIVGDFSTSGLENPLGHLLAVLFVRAYLAEGEDRARVGPWLLAGLFFTYRLDSLPLWGPAVLVLALRALRARHRACSLKLMALGFAPFFLWELFALAYYGSLVPNTAWAKLGVGIPARELWGQGLAYLLLTWERDPLGVALVFFGIAAGLARSGTRALGVGLLASVLYVTSVGGDFMAGRFFSVAVVWAGCLACAFLERGCPELVRGFFLGAFALASMSPYRPLTEARGPAEFVSGVVSERDFYREHLGIAANLRRPGYKSHPIYRAGARFKSKRGKVFVHNNAGMNGYAVGPEKILIDTMGLVDAFVARLPYDYHVDWRTGHLGRTIPPEYVKSLEKGQNLLKDPVQRQLYDKLELVHRGPLFSWARFKAIAELHLSRS